MNQDIQTTRQLVDATLDLLAQSSKGDLSPTDPQVQKWKQVCADTVSQAGQSESLATLRDALHLSNETVVILCLLALPEADSTYADAFRRLSPDGNAVPDLDLLTSMVCTDYAAKSALLQSLDSRSPLFFWKYLVAKGKGPMANRPLSLDPVLSSFFSGTLEEAPGNLLSYWPGSPLKLKADSDIHTSNQPLQIICGGGSSERQLTVAINLANSFFKKPLYRLNADIVHTQPGDDALRRAFSFALLKKAAVYWQDALQDLNAHPENIGVTKAWLNGNVLFAGDSLNADFPEVIDPLAATTIQLTPLDNADKTQVWKNMGAAFLGNNTVQWEQCAQRYGSNIARVGKALLRQKQGKNADGNYSTASVMQSFLDTSPASIGGGLAQLQPSQGSVTDMVLNYSVQKELHAVSDAFLNRATLQNSPSPGIVCLLQGPPGNGKTMAAQALAADLKLPLYQLNCSELKSASEGALGNLFSEAEQNGAALLFDEADAFFTSKDDRSGPGALITSFLIHKAESYPGLMLLTTNKPGRIDPSFLRRARTITMVLPTPGQRISLMHKTAEHNNAVFDQHVNLAYYASAFELTHRHVNRIVCNAVLAARARSTSSEKVRITNADFKQALQYELK